MIESILASRLSQRYRFQRIVTTRGRMDFYSLPKAMVSIALLKDGVSLAHIHMASKGSFLRKERIVRLCAKEDIPVIIHLHGALFREYYTSAHKGLQNRISNCLKLSQKIIVLARDWLLFMRELGLEEKCEVVPNFVSIPAKCHVFAEKAGLQILFMGRIGDRKGSFDLIRAFSALVKEPGGEACRLVLAGDGERQKAANLCAKLGISAFVSLPGWVSGYERERLFMESDVLALPSYAESFGLSLVEGMSYGLPIIGGNATSIPYVVKNREDGLLARPGNISEITAAMRYFLDYPQERRRMGETARKHAEEKYSERAFTERLERIYERQML